MSEQVGEGGPSQTLRQKNEMQSSAESIARSKASLSAYHAETSARRRALQEERDRLIYQSRDLLLNHLAPREDDLEKMKTERRAAFERWGRNEASARPDLAKIPVRDLPMMANALVIKSPPYDFDWTAGGSQGYEAASAADGTYSLAVQSIGAGSLSVAAGVGFSFYSEAGNPAQRFAAAVDYFDDWWDMADLYVAHNDGRTYLAVYGESERAWVVQSSQSFSWSDGAKLLQHHGNDPEGASGRVACETFFNAAPNSVYQCWIWSSAEVYADSGLFGLAASTIHMNVSIPLVVMGSITL
jgi:hypothetical protein